MHLNPAVRMCLVVAVLGLSAAAFAAAAPEKPAPAKGPVVPTPRAVAPGIEVPTRPAVPPMAMPSDPSFGPPGMMGPSAMAAFDENKDGALSREEFGKASGEVFEALDANGDGKIESAEAPRDTRQLFMAPELRARDILLRYDMNNDQKISAEEALLPSNLFGNLDKNNSEALEADELAKLPLAQALMLQDTTRRNQALLRELDADKDQKLSAKEFTVSEAAFKQADRNNDKVLDAGEIATLPPPPVGSPAREAAAMMSRADADNDRRLTAEELKKVGALPFATLDTNKDGGIDLAELTAWQQNAGSRSGMRDPVSMSAQLMTRFDKNGDGKITKEEQTGMLPALWQRWDRNGDGVIEATEIQETMRPAMGAPGMPGGMPGVPPSMPAMPPAGAPGAGMGMDPAQMIQQSDADKDGKLSSKELGLSPAMFEKIDANKDGQVTADELGASMKSFHGGATPMMPGPAVTPTLQPKAPQAPPKAPQKK